MAGRGRNGLEVRSVLAALVAVAWVAVSTSCATVHGQGGWRRFEAGKAFSFQGPGSLEKVPLQGIDSFVGRYVGPGLVLDFDYGMYSGGIPDGVPRRTIRVSGTRAQLARWRSTAPGDSFPYRAQLFVRIPDQPRVSLGFYIRSRTAAGQDLAEHILRSVKLLR